MKKAFIYLMLIAGLAGCQDQEIIFPNHTVQSVYFPHQTPWRTLSLGEDRLDNSLDRELKFDIGINIGGVYKNTKNISVDYIVDASLCDDVFTGTSQISPMPESYYTLSPLNTAVIPSGSFVGKIRVQLSSDFLDDPRAIDGTYAIPLRITGGSADTILLGMPAAGITNPDGRVISDWEAGKTPKDWVLFGVKYYNAYHGTYLQRGRNIRFQAGVPLDTVIYKAKFVEQDQLIKFTTVAKDRIVTNGVSNKFSSGTNNYSMELSFANITGASGAVTVSPAAGSLYSVTGTGEFFQKADSKEGFAELIFQSMHLNYTYTDGVYTHQVTDTLIFRDRGIKFEEFPITVTPAI